MKLLDYKTVTNKDIFLRNLQGGDVEFDLVANDDLPAFFRVCMKLNFLDFMCQKEYRGTLAIFKIMSPFQFHMQLDRSHGLGLRRTMVSMFPNDLLTITEILMAHDYYREPDPDNKRYLHELFFDLPYEHRNKSYKNFNYEI